MHPAPHAFIYLKNFVSTFKIHYSQKNSSSVNFLKCHSKKEREYACYGGRVGVGNGRLCAIIALTYASANLLIDPKHCDV